ncbi:MAG: hypothetical protein SF187_09575 [Deltaproteobacteria bacterium]|nr:hypothetical protein [Deltaproteobacteria bacterium]
MNTKVRAAAATILLLLGLVYFAVILNHLYSVTRWLAWRYLIQWSLASFWTFGCLSLGHYLVRHVLKQKFPAREHVLLSLATGVLAFGLVLFSCGLLGGLNGVFFLLCPFLLSLTFGPSFLVYAKRRCIRLVHLTAANGRAALWGATARVFGLAGIAIIVLQIMTPQNVAFDAHWYHAAIAESYAVTGHIRRFNEGWFLGTLPQLATWIYTWAFLCPRASLAFRIELAAHLELVLFLFTLAGVEPTVRWLLKGEGARAAWVSVFLFPGIFVYDSNLNLSADHILGFWTLPALLVARRLFPVGSEQMVGIRRCVLLGIILSGALLTKYQVLYLVVALTFLLFMSTFDDLWTSPRVARPRIVLLAFARLSVAGVTVGVLTSPHWLKNLIWHGNPFYPFAHKLFGGFPWTAGTEFRLLDAGWTPEGPLWGRLKETLVALASFSFKPHDWPDFHRDLPIFGSVFTLIMIPCLIIKPQRRLFSLALSTLVAIGTWYWTYHQDRYLQSLLPWIATFTAAALVTLWRTQSLAIRLALVSLIGIQLIWGFELPALPTHAMAGRSPIMSTLDRLSSGYRGDWANRDDPATSLPRVAARLPERAVALLHEEHLRLGLGHWIVSDSFGRQGAIRYRNWDTRRRVYDRLAALGVTHIILRAEPTGDFSLADNIVLFDFLKALPLAAEVEGYRIFEMRDSPRLQPTAYAGALVVKCNGELRTVRTVKSFDTLGGFASDDCAPDLGRLESASAHVRFVIAPQKLNALGGRLGPKWQQLFSHSDVLVFARVADNES